MHEFLLVRNLKKRGACCNTFSCISRTGGSAFETSGGSIKGRVLKVRSQARHLCQILFFQGACASRHEFLGMIS